MGSCATLWAFEPDPYADLVGRPPPPPPPDVDPSLWAAVLGGSAHDDEVREHLRALAEDVPVEAGATATWRDPVDNDLSRIAQGEAFDPLPAERAAQVLARPALLERHAGERLYPGFVFEPAERLALEALGGLLGLEPRRPAQLPWWVRARWSSPGAGFRVGLLPPDEVRALRDALGATRLLDTLLAWDEATTRGSLRARTYSTLRAFVERAADARCAILGVEGQS